MYRANEYVISNTPNKNNPNSQYNTIKQEVEKDEIIIHGNINVPEEEEHPNCCGVKCTPITVMSFVFINLLLLILIYVIAK